VGGCCCCCGGGGAHQRSWFSPCVLSLEGLVVEYHPVIYSRGALGGTFGVCVVGSELGLGFPHSADSRVRLMTVLSASSSFAILYWKRTIH
jgi:hypothetical protein